MTPNTSVDPSTLLRAAVMVLAVFVALPMFFHPRSDSSLDTFDLIRGVLFGVTIGLVGWSHVAAKRRGHDGSRAG